MSRRNHWSFLICPNPSFPSNNGEPDSEHLTDSSCEDKKQFYEASVGGRVWVRWISFPCGLIRNRNEVFVLMPFRLGAFGIYSGIEPQWSQLVKIIFLYGSKHNFQRHFQHRLIFFSCTCSTERSPTKGLRSKYRSGYLHTFQHFTAVNRDTFLC